MQRSGATFVSTVFAWTAFLSLSTLLSGFTQLEQSSQSVPVSIVAVWRRGSSIGIFFVKQALPQSSGCSHSARCNRSQAVPPGHLPSFFTLIFGGIYSPDPSANTLKVYRTEWGSHDEEPGMAIEKRFHSTVLSLLACISALLHCALADSFTNPSNDNTDLSIHYTLGTTVQITWDCSLDSITLIVGHWGGNDVGALLCPS